jgi:hypothetical protein
MSVAFRVDLEMDQGSDWASQIYWTDASSTPFTVTGPMRMEIRNDVGGVVITLQTNDTSTDELSDPDNQSILYNSESGLIQLQVRGTDTNKLAPGNYLYDLFVHYTDSVTGFVRVKRLIEGIVAVNRRVTQNI